MSEALRAIDALVTERSLLRHSFYTRWVEGSLPLEALRCYARQYYRFEAEFPRFLSAIHSRLPDPDQRRAVLENLWDEEHGPPPHAELWLQFAASLGVGRQEVVCDEPLASTAALVATYQQAASSSPGEGLAAIYAYERQVPEVAEAKLRGLAAHYGIEDAAFWRVHRELDTRHAAAEAALLARHADARAVAAASRALDAWWEFLSGVEAAAG